MPKNYRSKPKYKGVYSRNYLGTHWIDLLYVNGNM